MPVIPGGTVELGYSTSGSATTVAYSATGWGGATWMTDALTFVTDGSPLLVEYYSPTHYNDSANNQVFFGFGYDGSDPAAYRGYFSSASAGTYRTPAYVVDRVTLSAGSHTVRPKSFKGVNSGTAGFETDGRFLRVSKIVNQNDGLKPFWTPPVVTSLPSQATEGDQALLYSASPYAGYQTHQYASGSWRTLDDSRGTGAWQSWTPTLAQGASTNITKTVLYAKYIQFGKTVNASVYLRAGAAGTAGSAITISLPVTAAASSLQPVGSAFYYQSTLGIVRSGTAAIASSTTAGIVIDPGGGFNAPRFLGLNPNITLTSNDFVLMTMVYEAA